MPSKFNSHWVADIRHLSHRLGTYLLKDPFDPSRVKPIDNAVNDEAVFKGCLFHHHCQGHEAQDDELRAILRLDPKFLWGLLYADAIRSCRAINDALRSCRPDTPEHRDTLDQLNIAIANLEYIEESAALFIPDSSPVNTAD